jgi:hypothetical protein
MYSSSSLKRARDLLLGLVLGFFGLAWAVGPVPIAGLPGGGLEVSDTDNGNGQAWGRAGGRTIVYRMNNQAQYGSLTFGVASGTNPSLAFDGNASGVGEVMTFNSSLSSLNAGFAVFSGNANINVWNGSFYQSYNVQTRFTMSLTRVSNGSPITLVFDGSGVSPGGNVLNQGDIRVNLRFEMQDIWNTGAFQPVLDRYDSLPTPPGPTPPNDGPVMTGVTTGFYYTLLATGMTIEQHDAHLTAEMNIVKGDLGTLKTQLGFIHTDWPLKWGPLLTDVGTIKNTVQFGIPSTLSAIDQKVSQLISGGGTSDLAKRQDVKDLEKTLMILWGLQPCPMSPSECAQVKFIQNLATSSQVDGLNGILIGLNTALVGKSSQSSVDDLKGILIGLNSKVTQLEGAIDDINAALDNTASQSLDVRAVQVDSGDPKKLRWIVKTTRDGVLVNASLSRFATVRGYSSMANVLGNATVSSLGTGMHDVVLSISKEAPEGVAYLFEAKLIIGPSDIVGSALVVTEKKGASPF